MPVTLNVPFKNQLDEPNIDHIPDINADENCLPTCIASAMQFLLGQTFTGEEIQHAVYGTNYRGGTSAVEYIQYAAQHGVKLFSRSGSPGYLVDQIVFWLGQRCPVIATIPSTYAPPADTMNPGSSHCILFYSDDGSLVAMNPWRAFSQSYSTAYWESIFCYGQVWVVQKPAPKGKPLNIPTGWKLSSDVSTLVAPNGHYLQGAFKDFVLVHDWHPDDVPLEDGKIGVYSVLFNNERLVWNSKSGMSLESLGSKLLAAQAQAQSLQSQLSQAQSQVEALKTQVAAVPTSVPATLVKSLNDFEQTMNTQLGAIIDSLAPQKG